MRREIGGNNLCPKSADRGNALGMRWLNAQKQDVSSFGTTARKSSTKVGTRPAQAVADQSPVQSQKLMTTKIWTCEDQEAAEAKLDFPKKVSPRVKLSLLSLRGTLVYGLNNLVLGALCVVMLVAVGLEALSSKLEDLE